MKEKAIDIINKIRIQIEGNNLAAGDIDEKQYNFEFPVKGFGQQVKVQVYFGKKGIRKVVQGNNQTELYKKVFSIVNEQQVLAFNNKVEEYDEYIGSDETGKGNVFGPLVVTAFYVNPEIKSELAVLDVRDSKDLSDYRINTIATELEKKFEKYFSTILISPEKYNELQKEFKNINKLLNWAHGKAISNVLQYNKCNNVIIDKFSKETVSNSEIDKLQNLSIDYVEKAEKYLAVAAASIIARYRMNMWFLSQKKKGIELPKGANDQVENSIKLLKRSGGKKNVGKYAKLHFKNVQKLIS